MDEFDKMAEELLPCQHYNTDDEIDRLRAEIAELKEGLSNQARLIVVGAQSQAELKAEIAALKAKLAEYEYLAAAYGLQAKELEQAKAEIERLKNELLRIGDMAVVDWNCPVVGEVDKVVPSATPTYRQWLIAEQMQVENLKAENAELKAKIEKVKP